MGSPSCPTTADTGSNIATSSEEVLACGQINFKSVERQEEAMEETFILHL